MSYQEKRTIANLVAGIAVIAAYCIHAVTKLQTGAASLDDLKPWAISMLIFVGIGIAAMIVINIVFHIILAVIGEIKREKTIDDHEDEMDKLISLKSLRVGYIIGGGGFLLSLVLLSLGCAAAVMINVLFVCFSAASLAEGVSSLILYRKGVRNG